MREARPAQARRPDGSVTQKCGTVTADARLPFADALTLWA